MLPFGTVALDGQLVDNDRSSCLIVGMLGKPCSAHGLRAALMMFWRMCEETRWVALGAT